MCGKRIKQVYQGKTYRREAVAVNDDLVKKYGNAWQNGDSGKMLKDNIVGPSYYRTISVQNGMVPTSKLVSTDEAGYIKAQQDANPYAGTPFGGPAYPTYKINASLSSGVYGADDGSFLHSSAAPRQQYSSTTPQPSFNTAPVNLETWRYIEDANGTFGAENFNDKGIPTGFMDLSRFRIQSTSVKDNQELSNMPDPKKRAEMTNSRQRQTGSVNTNSFRIELGTPTKKSGLRVPE